MELAAQDYCASVRDGTHDSPKQSNTGKKLITSRHIIGGRIDLENAYLISDSDFAEINRRSKVDQWDVLITMIGTVGEPCLVSEVPDFAIKNIGLFKSRSKLHGQWLYYYLKSPATQALIRAKTSGTTQAYVPLGTLRLLPIMAPESEAETEAIASCLSALDDKIELNRRMNETLEAMARALFKDWFVDFGPTRAKRERREPYLASELWALFPDRMDEKGKPEGWQDVPFSDLLSIIGGGTPKTSVDMYWGDSIPWFSVVDTPPTGSVFVIDTEKSITEAGLENSSARLVPVGTTIISARGTVGNLAVTGKPMTFNQSCYGLRGADPVGDYFVYLAAQQVVGRLQAMAHGSVFSTITRQTFDSATFARPHAQLLQSFETYVAPMFHRILSGVQESRTLAQTRDLLLPKLMSGEIRVRDAERVVEAML